MYAGMAGLSEQISLEYAYFADGSGIMGYHSFDFSRLDFRKATNMRKNIIDNLYTHRIGSLQQAGQQSSACAPTNQRQRSGSLLQHEFD